MTTTRRLAAILAADVAGYSRLMAADEVGTLAALKACRREVVDPAIAEHHGRIVKTTGDGMLVEFASAVDAVTCAMAVQDKMAERRGPIHFRIGINIGDIISDGDDIFGDGVNVAARVENECEPGRVYLSDDAHRQIVGKVEAAFENLGERTLKNIAKPVRLYAAGGAKGDSGPNQALTAASLPLPDKPSIAVLPFQNMSGDPEQEYFCDGMVEEITTALSRFHWLFVIARNSSFAYKGKSPDIRQVGRDLGVRYVLEGSIRKAGSRVRITGQLIDAANGAHLWADRFESELEDIFDLQDQVASSVVGAIDPKLLEAEMARVKRTPVASLDAYDCYLRALDYVYQWTDEANERALQLFYKTIELDPSYAPAYATAAWCHCWRKFAGPGPNPAEQHHEAERLARAAVRLGKDDGYSIAWAGYSLAFFAETTSEVEEGAALIDRSLVLNPNLARSWNLSAWVRIRLNQPEMAIKHLERAMRLSPLDLAFHAMESAMAFAHLGADRYDEAARWAERAVRDQPNSPNNAYALTLSRALSGDLEQAAKAGGRLLELSPGWRISDSIAVRRASPERRIRIVNALRKAGLPE